MRNDSAIFEADDFSVFQANAVDLLKGPSDVDRKIKGYMSTEHLDRQDETVLQKGLDFHEFVNFGWFNDNHSQATSAAIGYPETASYHPGKGWHTEGHLLKGFKRADEIWELAKSLHGTPRRLGFSIEGKVIERKANYIVKARIRNVAITNAPVNTNCTWDVVVKSFDPEFRKEMVFERDRDAKKALAVGHARVAAEGGRVLAPEDLEHDEVTHLFACPKCQRAFKSGAGLDDHLGKAHSEKIKRALRLFKSEAEVTAEIMRLRPMFSAKAAQRLAQHVMSR
jgi:uncharacterized C2H2 Zn-finger protein